MSKQLSLCCSCILLTVLTDIYLTYLYLYLNGPWWRWTYVYGNVGLFGFLSLGYFLLNGPSDKLRSESIGFVMQWTMVWSPGKANFLRDIWFRTLSLCHGFLSLNFDVTLVEKQVFTGNYGGKPVRWTQWNRREVLNKLLWDMRSNKQLLSKYEKHDV